MHSYRKQIGFTLVEIMVSLTISLFVSLFSYQIFRADHKVFVEQVEVVDMQQSTRVAMDQLVRDLRIAGAGVPTGGVYSNIGFLSPVQPGDGGEGLPDTMIVLASFNNIQSDLAAPMPNESAEIKLADASEFTEGAIAIISGATVECGESGEVFQITHISDDGQNMLQHNSNAPWNDDQKLNCTYVIPATVIMVDFRIYYIDSSDSEHPKLMLKENALDPVVIAENIENLQIVYDLLTGQKDLPDPDNPQAIRKATITLIGRTDSSDPQWNNGVHSLTGAQDQYRRLTLQSDVQVRNLNR